MSKFGSLFSPVRMGDIVLPNRVLMAPLTRNRAEADGVPGPDAARYYHQRAAAGLIVSEATQVSAMGKGYIDTPGIYTDAQVQGWRTITDAVHAGGGRIFAQLWHVGRISHTSVLPDGAQPLSSTDRAAEAQTFTRNGFEDVSRPRRMTESDIKDTVQDFANAAKQALRAGFDGVEIHAANGYLLDQFLQDGVNDRDDAYGGTVENRMRFVEEVLDAVTDVWPVGRVGIRLSPLGQAHDMSDSDPLALFSSVYQMIASRGLAYLHVVEGFPGKDTGTDEKALTERLRETYEGFYIANGGYDAQRGADAVGFGHADAVAYGRPFIANPDLPERFRRGADLNAPDQDSFYGGGAEGYTDYPFLRD